MKENPKKGKGKGKGKGTIMKENPTWVQWWKKLFAIKLIIRAQNPAKITKMSQKPI